MALSIFSTTTLTTSLLIFFVFSHFYPSFGIDLLLPKSDTDFLEFALNIKFLEAEFLLHSALGRGLDNIAPNLTGGGPQPIGARTARLSPLGRDIATQFAFQEVGNIRAMKIFVPGFSRPLMNLSASFATSVDNAFGRPLRPPFDPYVNDLNFLLATYSISAVISLTEFVGANPNLQSSTAKRLVAGLLGVEGGQVGLIRTFLYQRRHEMVLPYGIPVFEFTNRISALGNRLGNAGVKDEGLIVNPSQGAEGRITGNVIVGDEFSLSYGRSPEEVLRIVYGSGNESMPGGFFPNGANGEIARSFVVV